MIYELRVYQPVPGQMPKLLARFGDRLLPSGKSTVFVPSVSGPRSSGIQQASLPTYFMGVAADRETKVDGVPERPCLAQGPR